MQNMFSGCTSLTSIDVSHFNTSNVTNMSYMFAGSLKQTNTPTSQYNYYEGNIKTLNLSNFDTSNVTNMDGMFTCLVTDNYNMTYQYYNNSTTTRSSLTTIYVSDLWDISKVTGETMLATRMFNGCVSLVGAISYDSGKTNRTYANYTTGYLTYKSNS